MNKFVYVKGCAGLGNRLVTIYSAIQYSKRTNRKIVVDWTDGQFDRKGENAFYKCFELQNVDETLMKNIEDWNELTHSSSLFKTNRHDGVYDLYLDKQSVFWSKFPSKLFFFEASKKLRRRWQPIKNGSYFNSLSFGSDLSENKKDDILYYVDSLPYLDYYELPNFIKVKPFILEKVNSFCNQFSISTTVGIHVRNTDKRPTIDVMKIIEFVKKKHNSTPIYLSTDSLQVEELFSKNISNLILYPKQKPSLNGEGLHQWALYNNRHDQKYQLFEESVVEMFLLSRCMYLYYQGNSTFSSISKVNHNNKSNCYDWLKI
jgi:hypothetical protein